MVDDPIKIGIPVTFSINENHSVWMNFVKTALEDCFLEKSPARLLLFNKDEDISIAINQKLATYSAHWVGVGEYIVFADQRSYTMFLLQFS